MILVCAGVILRSGKVLLARRGPGRRHAGLWEFPGGRVEAGESAAESLRRELREELGIEAEIGAELARARHVYDFGEIELVAFLVSKFEGEPALTDHDRIDWVEASRLLDYELAPADVPIAKVVASHKRRGRYQGTHPRRFGEKYKELAGDAEAAEKAKARGSTPAGAHLPIMLSEVLSALEPVSGASVLDCTLGWGGHAEALLERGARVIGLDRDAEELERAKARLSRFGDAFAAVHSNYAGAAKALKTLGLGPLDAVLADLGVSSMQLDRPERGMSFKADGPLDMRMDRSKGKTAAEWLAAASEAELARALEAFGQEPDAKAIAAALKAKAGTLTTTWALASAVAEAKGLGPGRVVKANAFSAHPAARAFQAIRIAVNAEDEALAKLLRELPYLLKPGGRAALLTFHSGEESLVGGYLRAQRSEGLWAGEIAAPKTPRPEEVRENPRARSARLWSVTRT
ncbi:MAG: 16S rRNA (cytosine(1402)-N(4))-methyltransferase RsmH [Elusimicrobia bacterium]|nr:16S rRNA (cytosine(1402)-N(4))-methyltransferase RsmH [Elusimicrobiota bacterium]